jgi:hypothetical protein
MTPGSDRVNWRKGFLPSLVLYTAVLLSFVLVAALLASLVLLPQIASLVLLP